MIFIGIRDILSSFYASHERRTSYSYGILWAIVALILIVLAFYFGTHFSIHATSRLQSSANHDADSGCRG